jgi:hypothetical protein
MEPKAWVGIPSDHVLCSGKKSSDVDGCGPTLFRVLADVFGSRELSLVTGLPRHCPDARWEFGGRFLLKPSRCLCCFPDTHRGQVAFWSA